MRILTRFKVSSTAHSTVIPDLNSILTRTFAEFAKTCQQLSTTLRWFRKSEIHNLAVPNPADQAGTAD